MKKTLLSVVAATAALGGVAFVSPQASAMPAAGLGAPVAVAAELQPGVEQVRWVCGAYRCWWRPGYGWGRPWGWHRHWGWHRWGWHRHW